VLHFCAKPSHWAAAQAADLIDSALLISGEGAHVVAIYVFKMKAFSRSAGSRGSRATSAAAYRAGERIRDERTGAVYDHHRRQDVLHKEIILPARLAGNAPEWTRTRQALWNAAEHAETRRNSRVAREFMLALPHELKPLARIRLAQHYAHELSDRYGTAIDLVIHAPRSDPRNFHAHLLSTTREVTPAGLGPKAALELSGTERHRRGLARWSEEKTWLRERWAEHTNQALREAHLRERVSHLGAAAPHPDRSPWLPIAAYYMEKQGRHSFLAERIRARHQQRLALAEQVPATSGARRWLSRVRERVRAAWLGAREHLQDRPAIAAAGLSADMSARQRQPQPRSPGADQAHSQSPSTPPPPALTSKSLDEAAQQSLRNWHAYRARHGPGPTAEQSLRNWLDYRQRQAEHGSKPGTQYGMEQGRERARSHDYDLSL
jgi:hypothetical protein